MWVKGELFDDLDAVSQQGRAVLDRRSQPILFDRLEWMKLTEKHCFSGQTPLIARARAEGSDAWLFLARSDAENARPMSSWYTLAFRPVFSGSPSETVKRALLVAIGRRLSSGLATITLEPVPDADGTTTLVASAFRKAGWVVHINPKTGNWTANTAGKSFDEFWRARPGQLRSTFERKSKKNNVTTKVYTSYSDAAWEDYEEVYADSWKDSEGAPEFLRALARAEGKAGNLRLGVASCDGRAIAVQFWTVEKGRAIIHKLAYREDARDMSPGTILSAAMFRHVLDEDHVSIIDYGTGDDSYKSDWMDDRDQLYTISMYNPRRFAGMAALAKAGLSKLLKR